MRRIRRASTATSSTQRRALPTANASGIATTPRLAASAWVAMIVTANPMSDATTCQSVWWVA